MPKGNFAVKKAQNFSLSILMVALAFATFGAMPAAAQPARPHIFPKNSAGGTSGQASTPPCTSTPLEDFGGPVLQSSNTYALFWGKEQSDFPSDFVAAAPLFFAGFGSSEYSYVLDQYMPLDATAVSTFGGSVTDLTKAPSSKKGPTTTALVKRVCKYIKNGQLPLDPVDPATNSGGIYFIFTTNFPAKAPYCGFHDFGKCEKQEIAIAYVPNTTGNPGCELPTTLGANTYTLDTQSMMNIAAHEASEATTDPEVNDATAWAGTDGCEIGDKCAWQFQSPVTLSNSTDWQLQENWSNSVGDCVQDQLTP
jgi:hypothetical protein